MDAAKAATVRYWATSILEGTARSAVDLTGAICARFKDGNAKAKAIEGRVRMHQWQGGAERDPACFQQTSMSATAQGGLQPSGMAALTMTVRATPR
jgi:hypothetical protein